MQTTSLPKWERMDNGRERSENETGPEVQLRRRPWPASYWRLYRCANRVRGTWNTTFYDGALRREMSQTYETQPEHTPRDLAACARELFVNGPIVRRKFQHFRPYICPFERLMRHVPPGSTVLDIGCGAGLFLGLLSYNEYRIRGVGCDPSQTAIEAAQQMALQAKSARPTSDLCFSVIKQDRDIPMGPFDIVTLIDVMHHVPVDKQRAFFTSAALRVRHGGRLLYKDMCRRPWWRALANSLHDLIIAKELIHCVAIDEVERWASDEGLHIEAAEDNRRLWYVHEQRIFRKTLVREAEPELNFH